MSLFEPGSSWGVSDILWASDSQIRARWEARIPTSKQGMDICWGTYTELEKHIVSWWDLDPNTCILAYIWACGGLFKPDSSRGRGGGMVDFWWPVLDGHSNSSGPETTFQNICAVIAAMNVWFLIKLLCGSTDLVVDKVLTYLSTFLWCYKRLKFWVLGSDLVETPAAN